MATITKFKITSVLLDKVEFEYEYEKDVYDNIRYGGTFREESGYSWEFSTSGHFSTSSPCQYVRLGEGTTTSELKGKLTYTYSEGYYDYNILEKIYYDDYYFEQEDYSTGTLKYKFTLVEVNYDEENDIVEYFYQVSVYSLGRVYQTWGEIETINANSLTFYPHPSEFTFHNCSSGQVWNLSQGLTSLITNLEDFYKYAQQWRSWKNMSAASACPSFADNDGYLTAYAMNQVYAYVNKGNPWKSGDDISAAMFNDLAAAINN